MADPPFPIRPGEPLDAQVRRRLERLLGRSLADMRVHDDAQAEQLVGQLGAEAFTLGRHVYVRRGGRRPQGATALGLLAHESTHVTQQTGPPAPAPGSSATDGSGPPVVVQRAVGAAGPAHEQAATQMETAAQQSPQDGADPAGRKAGGKAAAPDPDAVAERVYALIMRDLQLERERGRR